MYLTCIPSEPYRIKEGTAVNDYHQQKEKNTSHNNSDITVACYRHPYPTYYGIINKREKRLTKKTVFLNVKTSNLHLDICVIDPRNYSRKWKPRPWGEGEMLN